MRSLPPSQCAVRVLIACLCREVALTNPAVQTPSRPALLLLGQHRKLLELIKIDEHLDAVSQQPGGIFGRRHPRIEFAPLTLAYPAVCKFILNAPDQIRVSDDYAFYFSTTSHLCCIFYVAGASISRDYWQGWT